MCVTPAAFPCLPNSSPNQRAVYDVYGTDGLRAGLELGPALRTQEELRAELQARAAAAKARDAEAKVNYRATYVFGASPGLLGQGKATLGVVSDSRKSAHAPLKAPRRTSTPPDVSLVLGKPHPGPQPN